MRWVIDGNNVMGAGGDGWWNDPAAASRRLTQQIARWCRTHEDPVLLVFDGSPDEALTVLAGGNLEIAFATRSGRDAADDRIVQEIDGRFADEDDIVVVTSDRGLRARLRSGIRTEGAGTFRRRVDADANRSRDRR